MSTSGLDVLAQIPDRALASRFLRTAEETGSFGAVVLRVPLRRRNHPVANGPRILVGPRSQGS